MDPGTGINAKLPIVEAGRIVVMEGDETTEGECPGTGKEGDEATAEERGKDGEKNR